MTNPVAKLLFKVLKLYDVSITQQTIVQTLLVHPDYPSMQSISDALDSWKVNHIVVKLTIAKLQALGVPVITRINRDEYIWVTGISESEVHYRNASGKGKIENRERFEQQWTGVTLAIEDVTDAGEPDYRNKRLNEIKEKLFKYGMAAGCIVLLTLSMVLSLFNNDSISFIPKILLLIVNAAGCFISYHLIRQEMNQSGRLVRKFCTAGAHIDCNQLTKSKYSKLFGLITWAEVGMAYFSAVTLWVAIAPASEGWIAPLGWLLLVPLPFTVLSLFTQAFLIRKWCLFCCVTVLLLWINAVILYCYIPFNGFFPLSESVLAALLIMVSMVAVQYICKTAKSCDPYSEKRETARFKYNYQVLKSQLAESRHKTNYAGFTWGKSQSTQEITLYVSIACSHCGVAIKELRKIMCIYPDFGYRLIFAIKTDDWKHKSNIIIRHFINLFKTVEQSALFDALDAWYSTLNKNLEELQKAFPVAEQDSEEDIDALFRFSRQAEINYAPAILINGRLLSQLYAYGDLYGIARTLYAEEQ